MNQVWSGRENEMNQKRVLTKVEQEFVDRFVEARKQFERAEIVFMSFLLNAEKTQRAKWSALASSFEDFVRTYVGKPELSKYADFKECVKEIGLKKVETIGLEAAKEAARLKGQARATFEHSAVLWTADANGRHMSGFEAERMANKVQPPGPSTPTPLKRFQLTVELAAENQVLRKEIARLESENKKLKKELAKYQTPPQPTI